MEVQSPSVLLGESLAFTLRQELQLQLGCWRYSVHLLEKELSSFTILKQRCFFQISSACISKPTHIDTYIYVCVCAHACTQDADLSVQKRWIAVCIPGTIDISSTAHLHSAVHVATADRVICGNHAIPLSNVQGGELPLEDTQPSTASVRTIFCGSFLGHHLEKQYIPKGGVCPYALNRDFPRKSIYLYMMV